jgi:predicted nucleic acid binding AN1-type Zn finger protein
MLLLFTISILPFKGMNNLVFSLKRQTLNKDTLTSKINDLVTNKKNISSLELEKIINSYSGRGLLNILTPLEGAENFIQGTTIEYSGALPNVSKIILLPLSKNNLKIFSTKETQNLYKQLKYNNISLIYGDKTRNILYKTGLLRRKNLSLDDIENIRDSFDFDCAMKINFSNISEIKTFSAKYLLKNPLKLGKIETSFIDIDLTFFYPDKSLIIHKKLIKIDSKKIYKILASLFIKQ